MIRNTKDSQHIASALQDGSIRLPSTEIIRGAALRLDLMAMLYDRDVRNENRISRHLLVDSSPQAGFNMLCSIEKRLTVPLRIAEDCRARASADIAQFHSHDALPLATLGLGCAGLKHKLASVTWSYSLITGNREAFDKMRFEVVSVTTDQGTEDDIVDSPYIFGSDAFASVAEIVAAVADPALANGQTGVPCIAHCCFHSG